MLDIDAAVLDAKNELDEEKPARKFFPAPEIEKIAKELIPHFHPHLIDAKIEYTFRDGKWNDHGRPKVGDVKLFNPYASFLTGLDFGIIIGYKNWCNITSVSQHKAIVDHLLSFCYFAEDDKTGERKWKKIAPSIHEFPEVVARHGAYNEDVSELEDSLKEFSNASVGESE